MYNKKRELFLLIIFVLILYFVSPLSAAQRLINFQGRLTDQKGNPLDGIYDIKFSIYPSDPNIEPLWTEEHTDVSVNIGIVNILLGSITSFDEPAKVTFDEERYLGITIDCDHDPNTEEPEMTPRQRILPTIYSYNADQLDGKDSSEYTTPQTDAGRPGVVENLYEGNIRLVDKYIKQADLGNKGCYISYSGPDCLPRFENRGSLGEYGVCIPKDERSSNPYNWNYYGHQGSIFSPPGASCGGSLKSGQNTFYHLWYATTFKVTWGTAYLCCE